MFTQPKKALETTHRDPFLLSDFGHFVGGNDFWCIVLYIDGLDFWNCCSGDESIFTLFVGLVGPLLKEGLKDSHFVFSEINLIVFFSDRHWYTED